MLRYRLTKQAVADLAGIWNYTADEWSEFQADAYYEMLIDTCDRIAAHPNWFSKKYDEIRKGLLGCKAQRHIIFYMMDSEAGIVVIRILHERMDLKNKF